MKPSPIPSFLKPDVRISYNTAHANSNLASSIPQILFMGQRLGAQIEPCHFQGGTLNDCTIDATAAFTGASKINYLVEIDGTGTPDTFKWSKDGGVTWEATGVNCAVTAITLDNGVKITFGATTGHAVGDSWVFSAIPAGTVAQAIPTEVYAVDELREKCGEGSMLHVMVEAALLQQQAFRMFFVSLDDNGSNYAAGSVTITGPATASGSLAVTIGDKRVELAIANGDTAAEISIALANKLRDIVPLPVTVNENTSTPGKMDVIARNAGTVGNQIKIVAVLTGATGVSVALVQPTGGSTDPDPDTALTPVFNNSHDRYVFPWNTAANITKLITHLTSISDYDQQRPATAYIGAVDSIANLQALATGADDWRVVIVGMRGGRDLPYVIAAKYAAEIAVRAGADCSAGMNRAVLTGVNPPTLDSDKFSTNQIETLLDSGITPLDVEINTSRVYVSREVTTSLTINGSPTTERMEGNTVRILDQARKNFLQRLAPFIVGKNTTEAQNAILETVADVKRQMGDLEQLRNVEDDIAKDTIATAPGEATRANMTVAITPISLLHALAIEMVMFK